MKRILRKCDILWSKIEFNYNKHHLLRFFTTFLCVFLLYCIMYSNFGGYFMTNDDTGMMATLSGCNTGTPTSYHLFITTPMGLIYKSLYTWFPDVSWYSHFHIVSTVLCVAVILYVVMEQNSLKNRHMRICVAIFSIIYLTAVFIYPFYVLSWTLTAIMYSIAAVMLLLSLTSDEINKRFFVKYGLCMVFLTMSQLVRNSSYKCVLPFFFFSFAYVIYLCRKRWSKRLTFGIVMTTVILVAFISNITKVDKYYKNNVIEFKSFVELDKYRGTYSDFYNLPYNGNEELYESLGWDEEFYTVSRHWMYLDRRFNAENLRQLVEANNNKNENVSIIFKLKSCARTLKGDGSPMARVELFTTLTIAFVAVGSVFISFWRWRKKKTILYSLWFLAVINAIGTMEVIYLCFLGRFLIRTFMCAVMPTLCIDGYLLVREFDRIFARLNKYNLKVTVRNATLTRDSSKRVICRGSSLIMSVCLLVAFCAMTVMVTITFNKNVKISRDVDNAKSLIVEKYCMEHPDNIYVHGGVASSNCSLFLNAKEMRGCRKNIMYWGGSNVFSKTFYDRIRALGYSEFYSDNLLDDNVYFMSSHEDLEGDDFLAYMRAAYGEDIKYELTDKVDGYFFVYKFMR